ncbi:MAG: hypothetical protein PVG32_07400 [Anaerolineales bacterium]|jgi:hypothetical protein
MGRKITFFLLISLGSLLVLSAGLVFARSPEQPRAPQAPQAPDKASDYIPIQGRLTDADDNPLDGTYQLTFRIYDQYDGETALCEDTRYVDVSDGLFSHYMRALGCPFDGRQLYLGVQVEDDPEMTPRMYIDNVPYAWSLRPGAVISGTLGATAVLHVESWSSNGRGVRSYAMSESGLNFGVVGASRSPDGYGGYFYNNGGGVGLLAFSDASTAPGIIARGVDSGADLILDGNANTGTGDDGVLTSDPDYTSSDIVIKSNDTIRLDLDNDNDGEDADFEIRNGENDLIFDVDDSGAVVYGGEGIAAFPRPAYDSGWIPIDPDETITLNHNLGGNVDNYVVDLTFKHPTYGVHAFGWGGDVTSGAFFGAYWQNLTTSSIKVNRAADDLEITHVRVRIWMYP